MTVCAALCLLAISETSGAQSSPAAPACQAADHRNERRLAFGVRGRIQRLAVSLGDRVRPGTRLARLDCKDPEAHLQIAAAELEVVRAEYALKKSAAPDEEIAVAEARLRAHR